MEKKIETFFVDATQMDMRNTYFKAALYGKQGSGKTHTAVNLAIGIAKQIGAPGIAFYDTERAAAFHTKRVEAAGLAFYLENSKSLKHAIDYLREAERIKVPLVIDSVTHLWRELVEAYCKAKNIKSPVMRDWGFLKPAWYEFSDAFVHSKSHIIACGRAGVVTEDTESDDGRVDGFKVIDTKMKAEGEFGYEASLELEMERAPMNKKIRKELEQSLPKSKKIFLDRKDYNVCIVKKDRNPDPKTSMMGREIYFPVFSDFQDHMKCLNFGGTFAERPAADSSASLFQSENGPNMHQWMRRKETVLAKLWEEVVPLAGLDGTAKETKIERTRALVDCLGTAAKPEIEDMPIEKILAGIDALRRRYKLPPYDLLGRGPDCENAQVFEMNLKVDGETVKSVS